MAICVRCPQYPARISVLSFRRLTSVFSSADALFSVRGALTSHSTSLASSIRYRRSSSLPSSNAVSNIVTPPCSALLNGYSRNICIVLATAVVFMMASSAIGSVVRNRLASRSTIFSRSCPTGGLTCP